MVEVRQRSPHRLLKVLLLSSATLLLAASPALAQGFGIRTHSVAAGTGAASGAGYVVTGIIGQPAVGDPMSGGTFALRGGFRATTTTAPAVTYTPFIDEVITAGLTTVRAAHVIELRERIDALRSRYGLAAYAWAERPLSAGASLVRASHIVELRNALAQASANAAPLPAYTDAALTAGAPIKRAHIMELRAAVAALEQR